ncbi:Las1-like-domain-containing protein [Pseudomassariella vexata]|uniref:Las1-like-domain-containing protein n=1 Tax=Pseudomassariella vexata TaxID=1141098 RepID=A0A1Y2EJE8_9PEZI|nr:Las1-like-domain-containing protein [Pseudomassariella vexata]ORY71688.1 Las1-like-domain-containing protein [Pseudomassariella vexata]
MVQYIHTPWRDQAALLEVRGQFYPATQSTTDDITDQQAAAEEQQRHAVSRVAVWVQRGSCPHMVESTSLLMAALLDDFQEARTRSSSASSAVRLAYSAAFSRFVTGLLDSHQDKQQKQSMYSVAKTIGLPATFVELRHQCTHEQLPSLLKLRSAAHKSLAWIWDYYWKHLSEDRTKDIKAVKAEIAQTSSKLESLGSIASQDDNTEKKILEPLVSVRGWSRYVGQWKPKPIGIV